MYRAGAASWSEIHEQISRDNAAFKAAADSPGFDEAHRAGAVLAQEALTIAEWHGKVAEKCSGIAQIMRETAAGQQQLIRDADAKIAAAKLPGEAQALVTTYHGVARYQTEAGVTAAMALHTSFKKSPENTQALDLLTKWGDLPTSPPAQPVDHTSPASNRTTATTRRRRPCRKGAIRPSLRSLRLIRRRARLRLSRGLVLVGKRRVRVWGVALRRATMR